MKNVWENLYSHYNDSHYYLSSSSSRFSFLQNWWNNKTWWWTKKPIVKLHWCVTSDTSYDKIKKTLSYNTKNFGVFIFCLKLLQNRIWKSLNIQDLFAEARKYFFKKGLLRTDFISQGIWNENCHKTWSCKFYGRLWLWPIACVNGTTTVKLVNIIAEIDAIMTTNGIQSFLIWRWYHLKITFFNRPKIVPEM